MRILFFSHHSNLDGGASRALLEVVHDLRACGHEVGIVNRSAGPLTEACQAADVAQWVVPFAWSMGPRPLFPGRIRRAIRNAVVQPQLARIVRDWQPTHVYSNTSVIGVGAQLARRWRLPHLWHLHEFADNDFGLHPDEGRAGLLRRLRASTHVVFNSRALQAHYPELAGHASARVIYNGLFTDVVAAERRRQSAEARRNSEEFLVVGAIRPAKGQLLAIQALAQLRKVRPGATLVVAGSGEPVDVKACRRLATELGVSAAVRFIGFCSDPTPLYLAATACLMCSVSEAFGRVTAEAMACACPVIGNDCGATPELVRHRDTGLLFRQSAESLTEAMNYICGHPRQAEEMGARAQQFALSAFSRPTITRQICDLLDGGSAGANDTASQCDSSPVSPQSGDATPGQ
jgi:glycosyltransferase involved in cell wall biosynthesis